MSSSQQAAVTEDCASLSEPEKELQRKLLAILSSCKSIPRSDMMQSSNQHYADDMQRLCALDVLRIVHCRRDNKSDSIAELFASNEVLAQAEFQFQTVFFRISVKFGCRGCDCVMAW